MRSRPAIEAPILRQRTAPGRTELRNFDRAAAALRDGMSILLGDEAFRWSKLVTSSNSVRPIPHPQGSDGTNPFFLGQEAFATRAVAAFGSHSGWLARIIFLDG
jgi:hypothetical protein